MQKIIFFTAIFISLVCEGNCFKKINLEIIEKKKQAIFYRDKSNGYLVTQTCFKSDASVIEMKERYKKSGEIENSDDDSFFHFIEIENTVLASCFIYDKNSTVLTVLAKDKSKETVKAYLENLKKNLPKN